MSLTKNLQLSANSQTKEIKITGFFNGTDGKPQFDVYDVVTTFDNNKNTLVIYYGNKDGDINEFDNDSNRKITIPSGKENHSTSWDINQNECEVVFNNDNSFTGIGQPSLMKPGQVDKDVLSIAWY